MTDELEPAALGWRAHSGWAVLVAVAGRPGAPAAVGRWRVELAASGGRGSAQPYHLAAGEAGLDARRASAAARTESGLDLRAAERVVRRAAEEARELAGRGLAAAESELRRHGLRVVGCGLVLASGRPAPPLAETLSSHALIHSAEGELFRQAIFEACASRELRIEGVRERDLAARAAAGLGRPAERALREAAEMGRALGPPWRQDEKQAALVGWLVLAASLAARPPF